MQSKAEREAPVFCVPLTVVGKPSLAKRCWNLDLISGSVLEVTHPLLAMHKRDCHWTEFSSAKFHRVLKVPPINSASGAPLNTSFLCIFHFHWLISTSNTFPSLSPFFFYCFLLKPAVVDKAGVHHAPSPSLVPLLTHLVCPIGVPRLLI